MATFRRRFSLLGERIERNVSRVVRQVALAIDQVLVTSTPVDTGRARSNWIVQIGQEPDKAIEPYAPGEQGSTAAQNTAAALAQAQAVVALYESGQTIYITNNLPYIQRLNEGHSAQAPAGFVQQAVQTAAAAVANARVTER